MYGLTPFNKNQMQRRDGHDFVDFYNMFDDFFNNNLLNAKSLRNDTFKLDVKEEDTSYIVEAEMPGVKREDIKLDYQNDNLIISVQSNEEIKEEKDNFIHRERRSTSMQRAIYLKDINAREIDAALQDGVLKIVLPKTEPTDARLQIEIK
ncbi:Hsp20/alpha crystallin family protein [Sinanaerobacter sp. ZZT-01]|uniref:Hsp20/alpha crystallin family protein n=1 Tax=Sinanaerobacter sp. ZZT-01 TaxID=3111540 RepID=UPI002D7A3CDC|nr:Hsp20/alpha crystallin family protein [Sinanaerobacter sp. ZZT-01]WRR93045.1 Hsp20/alpha crystallin family protein [Sinanaerobacter sp. ZZT-01]